MENQREERLASAPMLRLILSMALPSVTAQCVNLLYSIVDRIYIGHIKGIGTDALAGVGITNSIIVLVSAFSSIVSGGGAPLAAIALGKGERKRAEKILGNGFSLLVGLSLILTVAVFIYRRPLLMLIGASGAVLKYALEYLTIYILGTLFVQLATGLNTFINAQGRPGIGMCSVIIGAILNIVLDPVFIFVFHMGVAGAAIATVISQFFSCLWVVGFLFSKRASLRIRLRCMRPDGRILASVAALGVSPFVMASTESMVGFVMNSTLARFGDIYISALTVLQSAVQLVSVPLSGFLQGVTPIISFNFGRGDKTRVKEAFRDALVIVFSVMCAAMLLMIHYARLIAGIFTASDALIAVVAHTAPAFMLGMSIFGLQRACQNTFVALGDAKISLFIALLRKVILLIPLVLILSRVMGVMGAFVSESIADATAATVCTLIFIRRFPKLLGEKKMKIFHIRSHRQ